MIILLSALSKCQEGETAMMAYKDCQVDCDPHILGNGCNNELESVAQKFHTEDGVTSCYTCNFTEHTDGSVEGLPKCGDQIFSGDDIIPKKSCPIYATKSCYHAASFHKDYVLDAEFTDDFRGCSPFSVDRETFCLTTSVQGKKYFKFDQKFIIKQSCLRKF